MGLVSTWLNGIGLSRAVSTFQAAGIVTPAALAELDVAHFEALGISDPDDRRKLFYLVQRIKMAVNKDKKEEHSVEDQVDAVISGTVSVEVPVDVDDDDEDFSEKKEERPATSPRNRRVVGAEPVKSVSGSSSSGEPRRSRRIATKQESTGSTKENQSLQQTSPIKGRKSINSSAESPTKSSQARESPTKSSQARKVADRTSKTPSPSKSKRDQQIIASPKVQVQKKEEAVHASHIIREEEQDPSRTSSKTRKTTRRSTGTASGRANAVFNIQNEGDKVVDGPAPAPTKPSLAVRTSGLKKPSPVSTPINNVADSQSSPSDNSNLLQTHHGESRKTTTTRRTESKLHPGKSMRTGKRLSAIPSEKVAPQSPLVGYPGGGLQDIDEADRTKKTSRTSGRHRRQSSGGSQGSDSLDDLLESSVSDMEGDHDADSDQGSLSSSTRSNRRRPKSMGVARITNPRRLSSSQSDLTGSSSSRRKSVDLSKPLAASHSDTSLKSTTKTAPFVQGGTQTDSWATQILHLRDDNEAEHELFRDQEDHQIYEYDMRIRVIVRKRPVSKKEASLSGGIDVIHPLDYGDYGKVLTYQPKTRVDLTKEVETIPFAYDNVFDESSTNNQIYQRSLRNLIHPFFRGQWSTVFAYGQTGSGKTYTMMGSNMTGINAGTAKTDEANYGLYYLAALDIFEMIKRPEYQHLTVQVSLFEIYSGKLFDLLNGRKPVKCLEDSKGKVCFPGLTEHPTGGPDDLMELIEAGATNRSTGTTSRNADSSRSHAVLQLKLRKDVGRKKNIEHGRLNFIDLAGSERGADTSSSSRATRMEGAEINTSLLALKEVIRALATGGSMTHIPFRGSKLTQVLKDSFVGENSRCCMVACVSPDIGNCEQTLNTLRYADRVKERDSESGGLANGYEQPIRLQALEWSSEMKDESESGEAQDLQENSSNEFDDEEDAQHFANNSRSDADAAALDDILKTSSDDAPKTSQGQSPRGMTSNKQLAGEALVTSHKAVMSKMLSMVKDEMALVNKVDADRDGLDDYLVRLESIQNTQLNLISKLRDSLTNYVTACEAPGGSQIATVESDEESFEDLRDL